VSLNQNLRPKRAKRVLLEQIPNTSSSDDMDDTHKDPDVCFLLLPQFLIPQVQMMMMPLKIQISNGPKMVKHQIIFQDLLEY